MSKDNSNFNLSPNDFNATKIKENIDLYLDQDILDKLRAETKGSSKELQEIVNKILRAHVLAGQANKPNA
jgi:uncharacterized protein (DUF4415 family)